MACLGNAAVDNIKDKLDAAGYGFVAARIGNKREIRAFIDNQEDLRRRRAEWLTQPPAPLPSPVAVGPGAPAEDLSAHLAVDLLGAVAESEQRLTSVWRMSRDLATVRGRIEAYTLESSHFEHRTRGETLPDLAHLPLLRRHSGRILDYLAETAVLPDLPRGPAGLIPRIRRYLKYGSLKDIDPRDTAAVLCVERAFYSARLTELRQEEQRLIDLMGSADAAGIRNHHEALSTALLDRSLRQRFAGQRPVHFGDAPSIRAKTPDFLAAYPVVLTTCHSIRWNLAKQTLLDWVIIDEATQTGLPAAAVAMSMARNVVVVGDLKQLGHILGDREAVAKLPAPPAPAYDIQAHSILSSMRAVYGDALPRVMLREHFRCARPIIEFCNQMFYDGALIPCTPARPSQERPLRVVKTAPGNHARTLRHGRTRGTYNQREIDVVLDEIQADAGVRGDRRKRQADGDYEVGVTTPFRLQADRLAEALIDEGLANDRWLVETVHKFQGRGARTMVLSTVIDEAWQRRAKLDFVDDPRLVNVAVSRAKDSLVVVTNNEEVPRSTHLKALIDYVRYHDPQDVVESGIWPK